MDNALLTRNEAAALSGVGLKRLGREIDDGVIEPVREGARSLVPIGDVHLLIVLDELQVPLAVEFKRRLRGRIEQAWQGQPSQYLALSDESWRAIEIEVAGPLYLKVTKDLARRLADADDYARFVEQDIERDPEIRGGEPVISGTRIPVRSVADKIAQGETIEVLRADFPQVPERALRMAPLWARANPRRGRPRRPWQPG